MENLLENILFSIGFAAYFLEFVNPSFENFLFYFTKKEQGIFLILYSFF